MFQYIPNQQDICRQRKKRKSSGWFALESEFLKVSMVVSNCLFADREQTHSGSRRKDSANQIKLFPADHFVAVLKSVIKEAFPISLEEKEPKEKKALCAAGAFPKSHGTLFTGVLIFSRPAVHVCIQQRKILTSQETNYSDLW